MHWGGKDNMYGIGIAYGGGHLLAGSCAGQLLLPNQADHEDELHVTPLS
jgi:hypothetical protein